MLPLTTLQTGELAPTLNKDSVMRVPDAWWLYK